MASIGRRPDGQWRARYRDLAGKEHAKHFGRKVDAQQWLDAVTASLVRGDYVSPAMARTTVTQWCDTWLLGYATRRASSVRTAKYHVSLIKESFGAMPLAAVKPSDVKSWTVKLGETRQQSTVYAIYRRLAQVMGDAVHDGLIARSPCSRRTSPGMAKQRPYMATTEQVWALYAAMPEHLRVSVLLGAFVGLRVAEAVALRVTDADFLRRLVRPEIQYPAQPLKSETSRTPVPIPEELMLELAAVVERWRAPTFVCDVLSRPTNPWAIERAVREVRGSVEGLPAGFRFHDLRHYYASLLIAAGLDVKVVQARLRHASATTTLNTYGHLWPDKDESARAAVAVAFASRESAGRDRWADA